VRGRWSWFSSAEEAAEAAISINTKVIMNFKKVTLDLFELFVEIVLRKKNTMVQQAEFRKWNSPEDIARQPICYMVMTLKQMLI
jgi:hypothetical protein